MIFESKMTINYLGLNWEVRETNLAVCELTDEQKKEFGEQLKSKHHDYTPFTFYDIRPVNSKTWFRLGWIIQEFAMFQTLNDWMFEFVEKYNSDGR